MSLKKQLMEDLKSSMKNKDTIRKNTTTLIRAAIKQREVDERIELSDDEIIAIISKQLKERRSALEDFENANRQDLVQHTQREIHVLLEYLPKQLSDQEITKIVSQAIEDLGASSMKDIGPLMKTIMPKLQGRADGKMINEKIKELLNK